MAIPTAHVIDAVISAKPLLLRSEALAIARAVIGAIREPDEAMLSAVDRFVDPGGSMGRNDLPEIFSTMIDAALK